MKYSKARRLCALFIASTTVIAGAKAYGQAFAPPAAGYQSWYDASLGLRPDALPGSVSEPRWSNSAYSGSTASMKTDPGSGKSVLSLDHSSSVNPGMYANYAAASGNAAGASDNLITLDFRFRLTGDVTSPQFAISVVRPPNAPQAFAGETEHLYYMTFAQNRVNFLTPAGNVSSTASLGKDWHDARLAINARLGDARLYLDGSTAPLRQFAGAAGTLSRNMMQFGDGSSAVSGSVELADLRWTNKSMAIPLSGGQVEVLNSRTIVENADEHINFPFVHRFSDGKLTLSHSLGQHTVTERGMRLESQDGGLSWQAPTKLTPSINATELAGGGTAAVSAWKTTPAQTHSITSYFWANSSATPVAKTATITLPWEAQLAAHRNLLEMPNGDWLQSVYGTVAGSSLYSTYLIKSTNQGASWDYFSMVATGASPGPEGFDEPSMVALENGDLLMLLRTGGGVDRPLLQSRSRDGGATWSDPVSILNYGVDPHVIRLSTGALVASTGRPGVVLLVDYTGTGDQWQQVSIYDGVSSSYTSLVETSPGVVALFYDESGFGVSNLQEEYLPNRLLMSEIRIQTPIPEPANLAVLSLGALFLQRRRRSVEPICESEVPSGESLKGTSI